MDAILNQIGELILGSVPTIVFFLLLIVAYGFLVRRPLDAVLAERHQRTAGAVEQARVAIGKAEHETEVFEQKLRAARAELMAAREARLKRWAGQRDQALGEARAETQRKVSAARLKVEQDAATARQGIEAMGAELSAQVLKAVLPAGVAGTGATQ